MRASITPVLLDDWISTGCARQYKTRLDSAWGVLSIVRYHGGHNDDTHYIYLPSIEGGCVEEISTELFKLMKKELCK